MDVIDLNPVAKNITQIYMHLFISYLYLKYEVYLYFLFPNISYIY